MHTVEEDPELEYFISSTKLRTLKKKTQSISKPGIKINASMVSKIQGKTEDENK